MVSRSSFLWVLGGRATGQVPVGPYVSGIRFLSNFGEIHAGGLNPKHPGDDRPENRGNHQDVKERRGSNAG
jgi:hypothetical protein